MSLSCPFAWHASPMLMHAWVLQEGWKMTRNQDLHVLHVDDAAAWVDGLDWRAITGDTLLFDYVYFLHPVCHNPWTHMQLPQRFVQAKRSLPHCSTFH